MHLPLPKISTTLKALMFLKGIGLAATLYSLLDFPRSLASGPGSEPRPEAKERGKSRSEYRVAAIPIPFRNINAFNVVEIFGRGRCMCYWMYKRRIFLKLLHF